MVLILLSSDNVSLSIIVIKLSNCSLYTLHCLLFFYQMMSDKCPKMEISHGLITWAKCGPLMCTLKLHFQMSTPPGIKLNCGIQFSSFCRDIHFQDFEDLSSFRYKIKFAKCHFDSGKTYCTLNIHETFLFFCFFFFFFFFYGGGVETPQW